MIIKVKCEICGDTNREIEVREWVLLAREKEQGYIMGRCEEDRIKSLRVASRY